MALALSPGSAWAGTHQQPGPAGLQDAGPQVPAASRLEDGSWARRELGTHAGTRFVARTVYRGTGKSDRALLIVREQLHGFDIGGSRFALRLDKAGRLRQVVGQSLAADHALPTAPTKLQRAALTTSAGRPIWWPIAGRLVLARVEFTPLQMVKGRPEQFERVVALRDDGSDGRELARWSAVHEGPVAVRGWPENPVTTPETQLYEIELDDQDPLRLENHFLRVWDCAWDEATEDCEETFSPLADPAVGYVEEPPDLSMVMVHQDPQDDFAGPSFTLGGMRFYDRLLSWGWDPYVWDLLDCGWQEVEPDDCRVFGRVNVMSQDEEGVFPFSGGFYSTGSGIWMGQGVNADTAFDGDIVVHEFGHHVTRGYGVPEATGKDRDRSRRFVDRSAINEGTSDLFARQLGYNDRIYDYYTQVEPGIYNDNRIRDVGIPFSCPANLVGESHMDGRIWVSSLRAAQVDLAIAGLVTQDEFMESFLVAHAAIRQIPREDVEQLDDAAKLVLDELRLSRGPQAESVARAIFDARGLRNCRRTRDLHDDPHVTGDFDPDDPLDDRFLVFTSHGASTDAAEVDSHPWPPPLHHEVTLGPDEDTVVFRGRPGIWRPDRPDAPLPDFRLGILMSRGENEVTFWWDDDMNSVTNDAEIRVETDLRDEDGFAELRVTDLEPGAHYGIALVSLHTLSGDRYVVEDIEWALEGPGSGETSSTESEGSGGESSTESSGTASEDESGGTWGDASSGGEDDTGAGDGGAASDDGRPNGIGSTVTTGCACASTGQGAPAPGAALWLMGLLALRRRREA